VLIYDVSIIPELFWMKDLMDESRGEGRHWRGPVMIRLQKQCTAFHVVGLSVGSFVDIIVVLVSPSLYVLRLERWELKWEVSIHG
jgi:hypothetical protein